MEKYSFFDDNGFGDREYSSEDFAEYFNKFLSDGVYANPSSSLLVTSNSDYTVTIQPGSAFVKGYLYQLTSPKVMNIDPADGVLNRIDRICVQLDLTQRLIQIVVKKGTPSENPIAPELVRTEVIHEICLAEINVNKGLPNIQSYHIVDMRGNNDVCGFVHGLIEQADTTSIFNEFQSWLDTKTAQYEQEWNDWFGGAKELNDPNKQNKVTKGARPSAPVEGDLHIEEFTLFGGGSNFVLIRWNGSAWENIAQLNDTSKLPLSGGNITGNLTVKNSNVLTEGSSVYQNLVNPVFAHFQIASPTSLPTTTYTNVNIGQTHANIDAASQQYIIPKSGYYRITGRYTLDKFTSGATAYCKFRNSTANTEKFMVEESMQGLRGYIEGDIIDHFNAGDKVNFQIYMNQGTAEVMSSWSHLIVQSIKLD